MFGGPMIEVQGRSAHVSPPDGSSQGTRFPSEWRFWIAENQLLGTPDDQIRTALIEAGFGTTLVQAEMNGLRDDPCYLLAEHMVQCSNKLPGCPSQTERLPFEWRFWMAENQLLGTSEEQIRAALIDAGFGSSLVQAEMDDVRNDPCY